MKGHVSRIVSWAVFLCSSAIAPRDQRAPEGGISSRYPGDEGIERDPLVLFVEGFETGDLKEIIERWGNHRLAGVWDLSDEVHRSSPGERSLHIGVGPAGPKNHSGAHLYTHVRGVDKLHARFYVKFHPKHGYLHHFVFLIADRMPTPWPKGWAGTKPSGDSHFLSAIEPWSQWGKVEPPGAWNFYTYWQEMKPDGRGDYWGNSFQAGPDPIPRGQWICVEAMVKANSTPESADGEQKFWIDGRLAGDFKGIRWRSTDELKLNSFWLQYDVCRNSPQHNRDPHPEDRAYEVWFDDIVLATDYIGPIQGKPKDGKKAAPSRSSLAAPKAALAEPGKVVPSEKSRRPLALHPENPHYFLFRGKPAVLITSGEHYGAVLNREFDYARYLEELQARGFNLTRTFSGTYRELPGSFGIPGNTLAPAPGSYLSPWGRSSVPGAADGGAKFNLESLCADYFRRLKDFIVQAQRRGIVVELVLFCTLYDDELWTVNPMNPRNNVQGIGPVSRLEVYSGKNEDLTRAQVALVRKVVTELNGFDNLYYEVANEPYERPGLTKEWNDRMIAAIVDAEAALPFKHLIAQGIAVRSGRITDPNPHVSVFNFHAALPESVTLNHHLPKAIADDETGGKGTADFPYRSEGWEFLLAGGGVFSHLDFSFTSNQPGGTAEVTRAPGGGGPAIRKQLQVLKEFLESFDFIHMRPDQSVIKGGAVPAPLSGDAPQDRVVARALVKEGEAYAIYLKGGTQTELTLDLPAGSYHAEWVNPRTGGIEKAESLEHPGGERTLASPAYVEDIALRVRRLRPKP